MRHEISLPPSSPNNYNEGPLHKTTDQPQRDANSETAAELISSVLRLWRKQLVEQHKEKLRKYIKKADVAKALSKLDEGIENIIEEYLNHTDFDENKYKKIINKANNISANWEDGFPVRRNKTEAYLKKELEIDPNSI